MCCVWVRWLAAVARDQQCSKSRLRACCWLANERRLIRQALCTSRWNRKEDCISICRQFQYRSRSLLINWWHGILRTCSYYYFKYVPSILELLLEYISICREVSVNPCNKHHYLPVASSTQVSPITLQTKLNNRAETGITTNARSKSKWWSTKRAQKKENRTAHWCPDPSTPPSMENLHSGSEKSMKWTEHTNMLSYWNVIPKPRQLI